MHQEFTRNGLGVDVVLWFSLVVLTETFFNETV